MLRHRERYWDGARWGQEVVDTDPLPAPVVGGRGIPGWRLDPTRRFDLRYTNGIAWTDDVSFSDPIPPIQSQPSIVDSPPQTESDDHDRDELHALAYTREFLDHAYALGDLDRVTLDVLVGHLDDARRRIVMGAPATAAAPPVPRAAPSAVPTPAARAAPGVPPAPAVVPVAPRLAEGPPPGPPSWPSLARTWAGEALRAVRSDLAVHGLAYLGVLLLFAGVFGFVAFTFGQVSRDLRPVAEVAIPTSIFLASWFLRRRGAPFVANALELLGGAVLPIVVFAAFVDGSDIPDDLTGGALEAVLAITAFVLATAYVLLTLRRPTTMLRFLAAPLAWLGVMAAMLATDPHLRGGEEITRPLPWQTAATLAAVFVTAVVARRWRDRPLSDATTLVVLPGTVVLVVLQVLASAREHWPVGPTVLATLAVLAIVEAEAGRIGATVAVAVQGLTLAGGIAMLGPRVDLGWLGVASVVVFLLLTEWNGLRRAHSGAVPVLLLGVAGGLGLAATSPWPMVIGFGLASAWAVARHEARPTWLPVIEYSDLAVVALPVGMAWGLYLAISTAAATLALAAVVFVAALVVRVTPASEDRLWHWSIPAAAGALVVAAASADETWSTSDFAMMAIAAAFAMATFVISTMPGPFRTWCASVAGAFAFAFGCAAAGVGPGPAAVAAAILGALLVGLALDRRIAVGGDLGLVGHVVTLGALVPAAVAGGWFDVIVLGVVAATAIATTAAQELRGSAVADRLSTYRVVLLKNSGPTWIPTVLAFVASVAFVVSLLDHAGWVELGTDGGAVVLALVALGVAVIARLTSDRGRISATAVWTAVASALLALPASGDAIGAVTAATGVATVAVLPARRRPLVLVWMAWAMSSIVVVRGALACGLDPDHVEVAWFAWGAAVSIVVLALDRHRTGDRAQWFVVRDARLVVPFAMGVVALSVSYEAAYDRADSFGWWSLALAGLLVVAALVAEAPVVTLFASAAAADAAARLLPWPLPDEPWNLVVAVVALSIIGLALQIPSRNREWWMRWDVWPFLAANSAAIAIVSTAHDTTTPAAAYLAVGAWALAVAAVTRRWPWLLAGAVLVNVGAAWLGFGWLALALVVSASGATFVATRTTGGVRSALQVAGAAATAGAWVSALWWLDVGMEAGIAVSAIAASVIVLGGALSLRWKILTADWVAAWCAVGLLSLCAAATSAVTLGTRPLAIPVGAAVILVGVASAVVAAPSHSPRLRDGAAVLFVGGSTAIVAGIDVAATAAVTTAVTLGFVATAVAALLAYRRPASPWTMPAAEVGALAAAMAIAVGARELPDVALLVPALAVAGVQAAVLGVITRRIEILTAAPVLLCASWLTFASDALAGNPEWFTVPIGITLLVIEAILRAAVERRGERPGPPAIVAVDLVGMAFVVGAALVQTVATSLWYGVVAVVLGALLATWGIVTRVRRRAAFGAGTVLVALVLLVGLPLGDIALTSNEDGTPFEGPVLWLVIAGIGLIAIMAAAFLEQGRRRVRATVARIADLTRDWE